MTSDDNDAALQHPHDLEAEKGVLRAMLLSQAAIADLVDTLHGARLLPARPRSDLHDDPRPVRAGRDHRPARGGRPPHPAGQPRQGRRIRLHHRPRQRAFLCTELADQRRPGAERGHAAPHQGCRDPHREPGIRRRPGRRRAHRRRGTGGDPRRHDPAPPAPAGQPARRRHGGHPRLDRGDRPAATRACPGCPPASPTWTPSPAASTPAS